MIEIRPYNQERKKDWEKLLDKSLNGTFIHSRNFMDYHKDRFRDASLMAYEMDRIVAVLPANVVGDAAYSHQGLTYGGVLVDKSLSTNKVLQVISAFLKYHSDKGVKTLSLRLPPSIYLDGGYEVFEQAMFHLGAKMYRSDLTFAVKFPLMDSALSKRRKRGLEKALSMGVKVQRTTDFEDFWGQVLIPNLQERHSVKPVHTVEEITLLSQNNPGHIHQFNACFRDELVAGITVFETTKVAHAQYIASTSKGRELHALDALVMELLTNELSHKDFFNFGIVNEKEGKYINLGLMEWKESFGAKPYVHKFFKIYTQNWSALDVGKRRVGGK